MKLGQVNIFRSVCQEFCPQGGMHGRGMCGRGVCGRGVCMAGGMHGMHTNQQVLRDTVNERAVRILLECILVKTFFLKWGILYVTIKKEIKYRVHPLIENSPIFMFLIERRTNKYVRKCINFFYVLPSSIVFRNPIDNCVISH